MNADLSLSQAAPSSKGFGQAGRLVAPEQQMALPDPTIRTLSIEGFTAGLRATGVA